jgi:hypothetical protein
MNFNENERSLFDDPNFIPTEVDLRKCMTRIARKTMQFLKKLKVPNEGIFSHPKFYKAMKVVAEPADAAGILQAASRTMKRKHLKPVIVGGIAFYLDHERKEAVPMSPLSAGPSRSPSKSRANSDIQIEQTNKMD